MGEADEQVVELLRDIRDLLAAHLNQHDQHDQQPVDREGRPEVRGD